MDSGYADGMKVCTSNGAAKSSHPIWRINVRHQHLSPFALYGSCLQRPTYQLMNPFRQGVVLAMGRKDALSKAKF